MISISVYQVRYKMRLQCAVHIHTFDSSNLTWEIAHEINRLYQRIITLNSFYSKMKD